MDLRLGVESAQAVLAELHGARYRLGAPGALTALLGLLDAMDGDLGVNVLNVWEDLTRRRPPPTLMTDAPVIAAALGRVAHRLPGLRLHADELAARLRPERDP